MIKKLQLQHLKLVLPVLLLLFLIGLTKTSIFQNAPADLSIGILLDLLITIPVVYLLLIRKTKIPKFTTVYVFLVGILIASLIIPTAHQSLLTSIKYIAIPVIELGILSMLIYKIVALNKSFKNKKSNENDFYDNLLIACNETFPGRLGRVLATEVAVIYYLFASSKKQTTKETEYTYFQKSGIKSVVGVFLFLILVETFVVHILVQEWNVTIAWVLTGLGLYTIMQIVAILRSMNKRLISIDHQNKVVRLRYGFACQSSIPFEQIERIESTRKSLPKDKSYTSLSIFDLLDSHNLVIHLNETQTLHKIYGMQKNYKSIAVYIDDKDAFVQEMEMLI